MTAKMTAKSNIPKELITSFSLWKDLLLKLPGGLSVPSLRVSDDFRVQEWIRWICRKVYELYHILKCSSKKIPLIVDNRVLLSTLRQIRRYSVTIGVIRGNSV